MAVDMYGQMLYVSKISSFYRLMLDRVMTRSHG